MKRFFLILAIVTINHHLVFAKSGNFQASLIDSALLKNADAVIREYNMEIDIVLLSEVFIKKHMVITVLNENGNYLADEIEDYSLMKDILGLEGRLYDKDGDLIKKIHKEDFGDRSVFANSPVYSDDKQRYYYINYRQYPYTVEYSITTKQKQTFTLPTWDPQMTNKCALEHATLHINVPNDMHLRVKENTGKEITADSFTESITRNWEVKNIKTYRLEPLAYSEEGFSPTVSMALDKFSCEDYNGSMATWRDVGLFIYDLYKGRDVLPDDAKSKVRALVAGVTDPRKKIDILYAYMEKTTRYVAVEYGINGWQPIDAASVFKNKYGDCKGLSNYMMTLLKEVGITSYPVIIYGDNEVKWSFSKNFPHCEGNHVILCVPEAKDTIWLECTSSYNMSNYLGDFTDDRRALMITPAGGVLVRTPKYDTNANYLYRNAKIVCQEQGVLKIEMNNRYSGYYADNLNKVMRYDKPSEIQQYENSKFSMLSYNADKYTFSQVSGDPYMAVDEHVLITANNMCTKHGNRDFLNMNVAPLKLNYNSITGERKTSFSLRHSVALKDTFQLEIPSGKTIEFIPEPVNVSFPFGHYTTKVTPMDNKLLFVRELVEYSGVYKKELYKDYEKFVATVNGGNAVNVVLTQN